jgi:hypothetical protein
MPTVLRLDGLRGLCALLRSEQLTSMSSALMAKLYFY